MKLIDILARELKGWPRSADWAVSVKVGDDSEVSFGFGDLPTPDPQDRERHTWTTMRGPGGWELKSRKFISREPCDRLQAIVTRAQWQAAVDALKAESAPAWTGEGLPPVGSTVETVCGGCVRLVEILCITEFSVFMREPERDNEWVWDRRTPGSRTSRPIKTAEQIAAKERVASAYAMCAIAKSLSNVDAIALYDAGWRRSHDA